MPTATETLDTVSEGVQALRDKLLALERREKRYREALNDVYRCQWADREIRWVVTTATMPIADVGPRPEPQPFNQRVQAPGPGGG